MGIKCDNAGKVTCTVPSTQKVHDKLLLCYCCLHRGFFVFQLKIVF